MNKRKKKPAEWAFAFLFIFITIDAVDAQPAMVNLQSRNVTGLNGEWSALLPNGNDQ
ncbi:hypothetical protein [Niastella populi]|uniref:hypothetical protein n=1 Tax=Niastella populi TaxID=550983 RepID=UPI0013FE4B99|nr:hypothetical protein [Niastella populi]